VTSITPRELKQRLERGDALTLLDVRERGEHAICALPGDLLIPMGELPARLQELDPEQETVVYCHHGIRSAHVIAHLQAHGFTNLLNLRGGIEAWARDVDPAMRRY
jgi:rhodanese-related sulfurtransferase